MAIPVAFHHVGITVSNLERAVEWYRTAFGLEPGLVIQVSGPNSGTILRLPEHIHKAALLPVGDFAIELLEFTPTRRQFDGRQDDVGYVYISFKVDDLDAVYKRMSAEGYDFHTEPQLAEEGQIAGSKFCVMRDPDGKTIEFIEAGPGMETKGLNEAARRGVSLDDPLVVHG
ncbi:MAG: VOC family protein [Proteobacteria bacterium]|nr:VOC family protein [Pseudomonadota bacterium]